LKFSFSWEKKEYLQKNACSEKIQNTFYAIFFVCVNFDGNWMNLHLNKNF
jgi:hypothetical protein